MTIQEQGNHENASLNTISLTNLKFNLEEVTEELSQQDFYGKVVTGSEKNPDIYQVTFTSPRPAIDGFVQAAINYGTRKD